MKVVVPVQQTAVPRKAWNQQ